MYLPKTCCSVPLPLLGVYFVAQETETSIRPQEQTVAAGTAVRQVALARVPGALHQGATNLVYLCPCGRRQI